MNATIPFYISLHSEEWLDDNEWIGKDGKEGVIT
jgi:hypothetical protein